MKIFFLAGRSGTGKDTIKNILLNDKDLDLSNFVYCTTREKRPNEVNGVDYLFRSQEEYEKDKKDNQIIEDRCYHTVSGDMHYYTLKWVNKNNNYLVQGSLEMLNSYICYFKEKVVPLYIDLDDETLVYRKYMREYNGGKQYIEMCRRIWDDSREYTEDKIHALNPKVFVNNDLETCVSEIKSYILLTLGRSELCESAIC